MSELTKELTKLVFVSVVSSLVTIVVGATILTTQSDIVAEARKTVQAAKILNDGLSGKDQYLKYLEIISCGHKLD